MKRKVFTATEDELIQAYLELNSTHKVASLYGVGREYLTRLLKQKQILHSKNEAARIRNLRGHIKRGPMSIKQRKAISEAAKTRVGSKNPFFGKTHSEEAKKKMSENARKRTKERNPNYKNGKYFRRPRDFKHGEFAPIKNFVFNRDKYKCFYCSSVGGHLHAHHKIPFWVCPDAFLDRDNLITTCTTCHFNKAHLGNWQKFDVTLISDDLLIKYTLGKEDVLKMSNYTSSDIKSIEKYI